ncbi:MAG: hypothetical protein HYZ15_01705 [Sphingobacteriales bacterium]|nr:hypothetical protein [Sphingobacteriales bacterium]
MRVYLFVLLLLFISCTRNSMPQGEFSIERRGFLEKFKFDQSGRFEYSLYAGLYLRESYGTIEKKNHKLLITSDTFLTKRNGSVKESVKGFDNLQKSYTIIKTLNYLDSTPICGLEYFVNNTTKVVSDSNGSVTIDQKLNNVNIVFFKNYQFYYQVKNSNSDYFEIRLAPINNSEFFFNKEKIIFRKKRLKFNNSTFKFKNN